MLLCCSHVAFEQPWDSGRLASGSHSGTCFWVASPSEGSPFVFGAFLCSLISTNPSIPKDKMVIFLFIFFPWSERCSPKTQSLIIGGKAPDWSPMTCICYTFVSILQKWFFFISPHNPVRLEILPVALMKPPEPRVAHLSLRSWEPWGS